jgi:hypothetical protein
LQAARRQPRVRAELRDRLAAFQRGRRRVVSTNTYSVRVARVEGAEVDLAYTFGPDESGVSKTFSFWLFVLAEGVLAKKAKGALAKAIDVDDVTDPDEFSRATEKRAMKVLRSVVIGEAQGGKPRELPRYVRLKVPASAPRPVVEVRLTMTDERLARSLKVGASWGGTAFDPGLTEAAFDYTADDWNVDDDEDDDD